jgi:hypothetical protein
MPGKEFQRELQSAQVEQTVYGRKITAYGSLSEHGISIPAIQTQGPTLVQNVGAAIDAVSHARLARLLGLTLISRLKVRFLPRSPSFDHR